MDRAELKRSPVGRSIIEGRASEREEVTFWAQSGADGSPVGPRYAAATAAEVSAAAEGAWGAFHRAGEVEPRRAGALLSAVAANLEAIGEPLLELAARETGLTRPRLEGELSRAVATLRFFADVASEGSWAEAMIDLPGAEGRPEGRNDLRRVLRPLGPVAVFGASNFPIAYSTAGTDTASALAAGCPVIVKGHPLHPGAGELVAWAVAAGVAEAGLPAGWFAFLHAGGARATRVGAELLEHPCIRAGGFTGSRAGGEALARIAGSRPDPIPFYAEMGSVNPVVVLPRAVKAEPARIGRAIAQAIAGSVGQQCTRPGLILVSEGPGVDALIDAMAEELERTPPAVMLGPQIRDGYARGVRSHLGVEGVSVLCGLGRVPEAPVKPGSIAGLGQGRGPGGGTGRGVGREKEGEAEPGPRPAVAPILLSASGRTLLTNPSLLEEVFGPVGVLVRCEGARQLLAAAAAVQGSLTGTMFIASGDMELARRLMPVLEQRCGRIVFNGVPTGVEVAWSMFHGGPMPSSNRPESSAVGPTAMRRWRRAVCYQNAPAEMLPGELRNENPLGIERWVNGARTRGPIGGA